MFNNILGSLFKCLIQAVFNIMPYIVLDDKFLSLYECLSSLFNYFLVSVFDLQCRYINTNLIMKKIFVFYPFIN